MKKLFFYFLGNEGFFVYLFGLEWGNIEKIIFFLLLGEIIEKLYVFLG